MASGYRFPNRTNNEDEYKEVQKRRHSKPKTYTRKGMLAQLSQSSQAQDSSAETLQGFSQMSLHDRTGSQTRERLAEIKAEIDNELESETVVRGEPLSPSSSPSTRESEKELQWIRNRKGQINELFETMKRLQTVDLCFLIDCTGSMDAYIDQVKTKIDDVVDRCKKTFVDLVLKVAFVGYRDHNDAERIVTLPFTDDIPRFQYFVSQIRAYGGDDAAEDVFGGLEIAGKLRWSAPTRILFHVADAPCHGKQYHDDVLDNYPNGDPRGLYARDLLKILVDDKKVKYWFSKLTDKTDKMIREFKRLMRIPTMLEQVQLDSAEKLMFVVCESISSSILDAETATLAAAAVDTFLDDLTVTRHPTVTTRKPRSLKSFSICETVPVWSSIDPENAYVFRHKLPAIEKVLDLLHFLKQPLPEESRKRTIQIAAQPFAQSSQRIVYYGMDCSYPPGKKVVFKEFKYLGDGLNKLESYKQQMEAQSISAFLAQKFNKIKPKGAKDIVFIKVVVISVRDRAKPFYCSQEPFIEGPYVKYNSNHGFVNEREYAASLHAFSHWTYDITGGYLMVVDLQGVRHTSPTAGPKFTLTDPAVHCKELKRFCSTNLGKKGMHRFFRTHQCNNICKAMGLQPHRHQLNPSAFKEQGTVAFA